MYDRSSVSPVSCLPCYVSINTACCLVRFGGAFLGLIAFSLFVLPHFVLCVSLSLPFHSLCLLLSDCSFSSPLFLSHLLHVSVYSLSISSTHLLTLCAVSLTLSIYPLTHSFADSTSHYTVSFVCVTPSTTVCSPPWYSLLLLLRYVFLISIVLVILILIATYVCLFVAKQPSCIFSLAHRFSDVSHIIFPTPTGSPLDMPFSRFSHLFALNPTSLLRVCRSSCHLGLPYFVVS